MLAMPFLVACQHDFDLELTGTDPTPSDVEGDTGKGPIPGPFIDVAVAYEQACVSRRDASGSCWGEGWGGQGVDQPPPVAFSAIAVGTHGACGLDEAGSVTCWGYASLEGAPSSSYASVEVGAGEGCALAAEHATCWSADASGTSYWEIESIQAISLGNGNSCSIGLDALATCWGTNDEGQASPPAVPLGTVRAGRSGTACGVDLDGEAICWGANRGGTADAPPGPFQVVEAGSDVTCGLHDDGTIECWGNEEKDLAHPPEGTFIDLSVADIAGCAVSTAGELACWGSDGDGLVSQAPVE